MLGFSRLAAVCARSVTSISYTHRALIRVFTFCPVLLCSVARGRHRVEFVTGLRCVFCGAAYPAKRHFTCPRCGITGILDVEYDYAAIARRLTRRALAARTDRSQWRYRELLPVRANSAVPDLAVGWTPLTPAPA